MAKYINAYKNYERHKVRKKEFVNAYEDERDKNTGGLIGGIGYTAGKLGLGLGGVVEGVADIGAAVGDVLRGDTEMAEYRFKDNMTGDATRKLDEWYNPGGVMRFVGDTASGIGQSSVFLLDAVAPGLGTTLFFTGVGGQNVASAAEQTGEVGWRELGYGAASGALEAVVGKAIGAGGQATKQIGGAILKSTGKTAAKKAAQATGKGALKNILIEMGKSAAGEGVEEGVSEIADTWLLKWFGIDEDAETSIGQVLYAAGVGAVSGGLMTAGPAAINYNRTVKAGRAVKDAGEVDILLQRAKNAVAGATRAENRAKGEVVKGADKYDKDAGLFSRAASWNKATFGVNRRAKQESKQAKQIRQTLEKNITGYESLSETVRNSEGGDALLGNLLGNVYLLENAYRVDLAEELMTQATPEMKQAFVEDINAKAKATGQKKTDYTVQDLDNDVDGIRRTYASSAVYEMMLEKIYGVGKAAETDEEAQEGAEKVTGEEVSGDADTPATEDLSGIEEEVWRAVTDETVKGYGVQNEQEATLLREAVSQNVPEKSIPLMLDRFREGTDLTPAEFADAWADGVLIYGRLGFKDESISKESRLLRMSEKARRTSIEYGKYLSEEQREKEQEAAKKKKRPVKEGASKKPKGEVVRHPGINLKADLDDAQFTAYKTAEVMAPALKADIEIHKGLERNGKQVNGYYDLKTNTIHININAVRDGKHIALYTLGHEVTHYIKEWSPKKFYELGDYVMERLGTGAEKAVRDKLEFLKKEGLAEGLDVTEAYDLAYEEVVADGMELVLTDGKVLEELARENKPLWQKIKDRIFEIIEKIKKAYNDLSKTSRTAQILSETMDSLDDIEQLFYEGVREAGERTRTAAVTRMNAEKLHDSGKKMSIRTEYSQEIEEWHRDGRPDGESFVLGMTGDVLQGLGAIESDIYINGDKIKEILKDHPEMTLEEIKKIPQILEDPVLILKSRNVGRGGQMNSRMVIFGAVKAENGQPVMSVLDLHPTENNFTISDMQKVTSAYTKTTSPVQFVKDSFIVYADKKRTASLLRTIGFQMPIELNKSGYIGSISYNRQRVNIFGEKFSDVFVEGQRKYSIDETDEIPDVYENEDETPLEAAARRMREREAEERGDVWTLEDEDRRRQAIRDHELLADALMETAQSESEYRTVKRYKEKVEEIADAESRITELRKKTAELNREMDSLREKIKGVDKSKREVWVMTALDDATAQKDAYLKEMDELSEMIRKEEAKLLSLAAAKPLQKAIREANKRADAMARVAEKERQRADERVEKTRQKAKERAEERVEKTRQKAKERAEERVEKAKAEYEAREEYGKNRREMSVRERVARRVVGRMNTMFYNPTKTKHVPADLQALVEAVLKSEKLDTFKETRKHLRQMAEMEGEIAKLEQNPARTTKEQEKLDKLLYKYAMLEDEGLDAKSQAAALYTAFKEWMERKPKDQQDKALLEKMSSDIDSMEEMPLSDMSRKSLEAVETFYKAIYHQVNTANQAFATEKAANIDQMSTKANTQVKDAKELKLLSPRSREWAGLQKAREYLWKNMKPLTVFETIGSDELMSIFKRVLDGEDVWITDILEAKKALDEAKKKYGYNKWNLKERREVTTADGSKVSLTLGEMMSLYAYMFREQAEEHLRTGGFVFAPNAKAIEGFKGDVVKYTAHLNDQTPHRMRTEDIAKMSKMLTEEQKAYAKRVQEYLTSLGAKGNEVSRKLYGIDLFKETAYFPIKSSRDYIETQTGRSGDPNIKSRGTFKETVPNAGNPIVLEDFMEVVGNHVNTMATYHAFVLPVEDLTRVWNYTPVNIKRDADGKAILDDNGMPVADDGGEGGYNSLKAEITKKYGKEANDYILQLLRDLNGGARRESAASILDKGLTAFKRSATMLSLSTIVQQPTSILRAMAYVDGRHFMGASFVPWETVKKYAPVAAIKEMGGFDTGTGARTAEFINAKEYENQKDKLKAAVTPEIYGGDSQARDDYFGFLTSKADEVSWRYMFGAIVNEQAEKLGKPKDSEDVLKAAGKRFAEVVRRTQVYDSTLTRSEYMRSKDGLMKMATTFGAEPTTVVSMVVDAIIKAERGDKTFLRKSAAGIAFSIIANTVVASLIYAMRDDDEDETLPEKYVQSLTSELIEGFNPLEYLPIARDVVSMFKGYEIERSDMALVGNLMEQVELITSSKRSVPDKIFGVTGAVSAFFGLPVTNVYRDLKGIVKTGIGFANAEKQTGAGFKHAVGDAVRGQFNLFSTIFGAESGNAYELYTAYVNGDTAHYERVKARYGSEEAAEMALRTELRDNDKRINQAAWCKHTGDLELYESLVDQIAAEGIFDRNIVIRAINNEVSEIKREIEKDNLVPKDESDPEDDETDAAEGLYVTSDMTSAMERGDTGDVAAIIDQMVRDKVDSGKTEKEARASLRSASTVYWKKRYIAAWEKNDAAEMRRIRDALEASGLYGGYNDMIAVVRGWIQNAK